MEIGKAKAEVAKLAKSKGIDVQSAWDIFFFDEVLLFFIIFYSGRFNIQKPVFVGNVFKQRLTFNVSLPTPSKGGKVAC